MKGYKLEYPGYEDIHGNPVRRTKLNYPYSYDPFVIWKNDYKDTDHTVFTDRLYQQDYKLFNACSLEVWGNESQYFDSRSESEIEKFLTAYLGKPIKLTAIQEACNYSSGYPYWILYFRYI